MHHRSNQKRGGKEPEIKLVTTTSYIKGGFGGGVEPPARLNPGRKIIGNRPQIGFSNDDPVVQGYLPMVIAVEIMDFTVRRVFFNPTTVADILHWPTFQKLGLPLSMLKPYHGNLENVFGCKTEIKGYVDLKTTFGEGEDTDSVVIRYLVADPEYQPYNVVLGWPTLNLLDGLFSTRYLAVKYPRPDGKVGIIKADLETARKCKEEGL